MKKKETTTGSPTIRFPKSVIKALKKLRVHPREPYYNVVKRLILFYEEGGKK